MQLHVCLLLFIVTTDTTLASWRRHCGGHASLDQEPAGHVSLTLSGPFANTTGTTLNSTTDQSNETLPVSVCTWTISIPAGRTVLLKLLWLESGSSITVRCLRNEEDRVLEIGGTALLSICFGNKATLSWTGEGRSSNPIQLSYHVQEDERNSSAEHAGPHSDRDLVRSSVTGTSFTSKAPVVREAVRGTEWGKGRLYEGVEEWGSDPRSASSLPSQNRGRLHATSARPQRLAAAGNADRETLSLPEEGQNNGADTSGATHHTNGSIYTRDETHPYFEHTLTTESLFGTSHPTETEADSGRRLPETQMPLEAATAGGSRSGMVGDTHRHEATQTLELSTTQEYPPVSSSRMPNLTSSHPEVPSWRTREGGTVLSPHGGAVSPASEEKLQHSWRGQRSTDRLASEPTSTITHDPLRSPTEQQQGESSDAPTDMEPTASASSSSSFSEGPSTVLSSTTHIADPTTALHHVEAASLTPNATQNESLASTVTDATIQSSEEEPSDRFEDTEGLHTFTFSAQSHTDSPGGTESVAHSTPPSTSSPFTLTDTAETQTATPSARSNSVNTDMTTNTTFPTTDASRFVDRTSSASSSTAGAGPTLDIQNSAATETPSDTETDTLLPTYRVLHDLLPTNSPTLAPHMSSSNVIHSSTSSHTVRTHSAHSGSPLYARTSSPFLFTTTESPGHMTVGSHRIAPITSQAPTVTLASSHTHQIQSSPPLPSSRNFLTTANNARDFSTPAHPPVTSVTSEYTHQEVDLTKEHESGQGFTSSTRAGPSRQPRPWTSVHPSEESHTTPTSSASTSIRSSTSGQKPKFYVVPDQPAAIKVESVELLLQIIVEESKPAFAPGLREEAAAWAELYLQRAPGFSRMLSVWSSGHAVQCLAEFNTSGALQWLGTTGPTSLLERTGLAQAVQLGRSLTSPKIINITLGGVQADVCDWLLQCPAGYKCASQPGSSNYSCSSDCHFDYCHHHGICTHHWGQLPVCHCQVGEDFWYMGQKCDIRMTRARLVGACLAILLIMVTVIGVVAFLAVRRYRALLIQAKVDQTRSSYRRFNHFDELSGRFWLRSWAESADSLDNPAFTRSDELLHLRALDRPCCYHDDTLSLASTCPSHGARINTIYRHSSQYGWRGSEMSVGDGVLDSGKASDLSVCSWPVEPIQWTPFPLLQQLASNRTPTVRVSRPRSYCEGMELVDMGKSWTA